MRPATRYHPILSRLFAIFAREFSWAFLRPEDLSLKAQRAQRVEWIASSMES